jgi:hypothetical protein
VAACDRQGVVGDVTLSRGNGVNGQVRLQALETHPRAVEVIVSALKGRRNWYLDLGNERSVKDYWFVSVEDLKDLRELARKQDQDLLVTASHHGVDLTKDDVRGYVQTVGVDFLSPHRPRTVPAPPTLRSRPRGSRRSIWHGRRSWVAKCRSTFRSRFAEATVSGSRGRRTSSTT